MAAKSVIGEPCSKFNGTYALKLSCYLYLFFVKLVYVFYDFEKIPTKS